MRGDARGPAGHVSKRDADILGWPCSSQYRGVVIPCLLLGAILAAAPAWVHRDRWNTVDGLPQSSVTDIAQGHDGLLYITTFGGPVRFDGRRFDRSATPDDEGWSSIRTTAIAVAPDGTQWMGLQDGGVIRQPPGAVSEQIPSEPSLAGMGVSDIAVAPSGVWLASWGGAAYYDSGWTRVSAEPSNTIEVDGDVVYIGNRAGLLRCAPECSAVDLGSFGEVTDLVAHDGALLVAGLGGLLRLRGDSVTTLERVAVERVAVSEDGAVWGARNGVAFLLGTDMKIDAGSGIRRLFVDREQSLWVATDSDGLQRAFVQDWRLTERGGGMPLLELPDGNIWVGDACSRGGVASLNGADTALPSVEGCVRALAIDDGKVWIGTEGEVLRGPVRGTPEHIHTFEHVVLSILPDASGAWVGTDGGGAYRIRDGEVESVDVGDARVLSIVSGRGDAVWLGTHLGLTRYHPSEGIRRWTRADGVPVGPVRALLVDPDGTVWMGSYGGGLGVLRDDRILRLGVDSGLHDDTVSAILDDGRGALWLNGNRGVARVKRSELEAWIEEPSRTVQVRRWATPEGNGGTQPAGIVGRDGTLWFPTISGVVSVDPAEVFENTVTPEVIVLAADVDGVPLVVGETTVVPAGPGRVQVEFTAGTLRRPDLARLEYRFVEHETDSGGVWKPLGDDRRVMWGGVEPGVHRIELRAANEDGLRSQPVQLRFELQEIWYERPGVWIGVVCALGLLGWAFQRWRTQEVQRQNDALSRQIEQRRHAEEALRVNEAHYRRVFEGGADALMVVRKDGVVEHANPAADSIVGRPVIGCSLDSLFGPESVEEKARPVLREGAEVWVSVVELPFDERTILVRATDVTLRLQAERERHQMSQRLAQAERMETVGQLAGGIAHDFNNLLTAVGGTAELLSKAAKAGEDQESLSLLTGLQSRVDRGAKLTRQLLSFARKQHLEPTPIDLGALLSELRTILRPSLRDDIVLRLELPEDRLGVCADTGQLELALLNLVLNSQAALPEGGCITMGVRALTEGSALATWPALVESSPRGWVVLDVSDDGVGIAPEDLSHVLDPFFTTREDGTGLGLPSAHGFALQSRGGLFLESTVGVGTTVSLVLPRTEPPPRRVAPRPTAQSKPRRGRVLVVDDDDMVRSTVVQMLRSNGYDTIDYGNPTQLLEDFDARFACDALVTDVLMPGVSGPKLATSILQQRPELPVIFMSGYMRSEASEALPGPLLNKPFRGTALLDLVARALDVEDRDLGAPP